MGRNVRIRSLNLTKSLEPYVEARLRDLALKGQLESANFSAYVALLIEGDLLQGGDFIIPRMTIDWERLPRRKNAKITSVSLSLEIFRDAKARCAELRFDSESDYFRRLVEKDLHKHGYLHPLRKRSLS